MGLGALLKQTAAVAAAPYVRFDAHSRVLGLSSRVVKPAAERALARVRQLQQAEVEVQPEALLLRATTTAGVVVRTTLVPRKLELVGGESLVVHAFLPRGISVGHENAALGMALGLADGLLNAGERFVNSHLKGAQLKDGALTYTRPMEDVGLPRLLRQLGWKPGSDSTVPVALRDGWLELGLRDVVPPDFQLDVTALLALLRGPA